MPFCDRDNEYLVSEERKAELTAHMDNDRDQGLRIWQAALSLS